MSDTQHLSNLISTQKISKDLISKYGKTNCFMQLNDKVSYKQNKIVYHRTISSRLYFYVSIYIKLHMHIVVCFLYSQSLKIILTKDKM